MAEKQAEFPQPPTLATRVANAWGYIRNGKGLVPEAQPVGINPNAGEAPEDESAPAPEEGVFARQPSSFQLDARWLDELAMNADPVLNEEGGGDLKLWEKVLKDDTAHSALQQRRLAVIARPWEVEPGDDTPEARAAADHIREQLKRINWDRICDKMLYGPWYGFAVAEMIFGIGPDGKYRIDEAIIPDRKWFGFTNRGELRMKTAEHPQGEKLPPNKFWVYSAGGSHDFDFYGRGLAHWCYWPVWFKRNGLKFWAVYLEKFGMPTALGKFPSGSTDDVKNKLLSAASAVSRDAAVIIPKEAELELLASGRTGEGSYEKFLEKMDEALLRVILSQTGTSKSEAQGLGGSQSDVMKDVRDEVVRADSDLLHESFNRGPVKWMTRWNFGPNVALPRVYRIMEEPEDLKELAERDKLLQELGWERTEESAKEVYGESYQRVEKPEPAPIPGIGQPPIEEEEEELDEDGNVIDLKKERLKRLSQFAASGPRPLYIYRPVKPKTAKKLLAWAKKVGIPNLLSADDLHVTIIYCRQPVDWFEMDDSWERKDLTVNPGGPRALEGMGDEGAIVLRFGDDQLDYRFDRLVRSGCVPSHSEFKPHITLGEGKDWQVPDDLDLFNEELELGPEIFEEAKASWIDGILSGHGAFSAQDEDFISRWADALASEAEPALAEFAASLKGKLEDGMTADGFRVALLEALERFPADRLAELAGLPLVAARAAGETGLEDGMI